MFAPRPHILLMIGDDGVAVVPNNLVHTAPFFVPTENKNATQIIIDFIDDYPQAHITLCADNLAQDYRIDTMPPLHFFDRAALIKRRLQQNFPLARLTAYKPLTKTRNQILLIGLNGNNAALQWADRLRLRLPRLVLLPIEGARLLSRMAPESTQGWVMLISRQKTGGYRQIVTHKSHLVFTRLTPLPNERENISDHIARDVKASLDYLTRQGLRQASELSVFLLMPETEIDKRDFASLSLYAVHCLSPLTVAQKLKLPFAPQQNHDADLLYAAALFEKRPVLPLMLPDAKRAWLNATLRVWGLRGAASYLVFSIIFAAWHAVDLFSTLYHTEQETAQLDVAQNKLAQAQRAAAPLTEPLGRLRQALARRHIYEQETPTPWHILNELGNAPIDESRITHIDWEKKDDTVPEKITLALRVIMQNPATDRAATVDKFNALTQNLAAAAHDYDVIDSKPPFPSLPQETVTMENSTQSPEPNGEIILIRKAQ